MHHTRNKKEIFHRVHMVPSQEVTSFEYRGNSKKFFIACSIEKQKPRVYNHCAMEQTSTV